MKISVITLFPQMFDGPFEHSIVKRAKEQKHIDIDFINIRDFGKGKHQIVDDTPYGGGTGMILKADVLDSAIKKAKEPKLRKQNSRKVVLLSPHGKVFNQTIANRYSKLEHLILVCGHYEDFDARIKNFVDEEVSIGDFILTGGEIPAMTIVDCVSRLVKGVLKKGVVDNESFNPYLEFPQYTKPETYNNLKVPKVLLSGNHKKIKEWRRKEALRITKKLRPDLLK
jgi:tRNA (guanine37-N1)-methyltransferase